jgi:dihydropteroate synthase
MTRSAPLAASGRTLIMGVLNVTPDSFSDGGRHAAAADAVRHAELLKTAGADLIDVGGESTRPGAEPVPEAEELRRVLPVVRELVRRDLGPLSIDTYKAAVARTAVDAGATLINDISGGTFDPDMLAVAAASGVGLVISHARARPSEMQRGGWRYEGGVVAAVAAFFRSRLGRAEEAGLSLDRVILDPGIGFGKTLDENLELLRNLNGLKVGGRPVLVGTSRKSFIGRLTGREVHDRELGTAATVALSVAAGADMVRVHDVAGMRDVCRVADAWVRGTNDDDQT